MTVTTEGTGPGSVERVFPRIFNQVKNSNLAKNSITADKLTQDLLSETLGVTTVNGQTGDVTVDVPVTSVNGQTGDVTVSVPVTSVNGQTGDVTVSVPVTSVNGQTGDVVLNLNPVTVVSLTYSSTLNTDASLGDIFDVTLTGNTTLANPTNPTNGKTLRWRIKQDATGNRSVSLGNKFVIPSSATSPLPFSTSGNALDIMAATYHSGRDKWDIVAFVFGY